MEMSSDAGDAAPRRNARGAWILRIVLCKNLPHKSSHALLPQRGAADSPAARIPPGHGRCLCDCFLIGLLAYALLFCLELGCFVRDVLVELLFNC